MGLELLMMLGIGYHAGIDARERHGTGHGAGVAGGPAGEIARIQRVAHAAGQQQPAPAVIQRGIDHGVGPAFAQHMGVQRSNEFFMFGRKLTAEELERFGIVTKIFPAGDGFHGEGEAYLQEQLRVNDGKSMMEAKRLQNAGLRDQRMLAAYNAFDALAERFVEDAPAKRFLAKRMEMEAKSKKKSKL